MDSAIRLEQWTADQAEAGLVPLGAVLHACVLHGASVGFVWPYDQTDAQDFWARQVLPAMRVGGRMLWVARAGDRIAGTVQLDCDTPSNQPHRAEIRKLLVHPEFRRHGLARRLIVTLETQALSQGRRLLTLDTRSGDHAEPLYASLGYRRAGVIPGYALDVTKQQYDATTIMYKLLT